MLGILIGIERDGETVQVDVAETTEDELKTYAETLSQPDCIAFFGAVCGLYSVWMREAKTEEVVEVADDGRLVQHKSMPLPSFTKEPGVVLKACRLWPASDNSLWPTEQQARQRELSLKASP